MQTGQPAFGKWICQQGLHVIVGHGDRVVVDVVDVVGVVVQSKKSIIVTIENFEILYLIYLEYLRKLNTCKDRVRNVGRVDMLCMGNAMVEYTVLLV